MEPASTIRPFPRLNVSNLDIPDVHLEEFGLGVILVRTEPFSLIQLSHVKAIYDHLYAIKSKQFVVCFDLDDTSIFEFEAQNHLIQKGNVIGVILIARTFVGRAYGKIIKKANSENIKNIKVVDSYMEAHDIAKMILMRDV